MAEEVKRHRRLAATLGHCCPGFCMSEAWDVSQVPLDGSFDLDGAVLEALLHQGCQPLSAQRLAEETAGVVYGAGNIVGNTATALADGTRAILAGRVCACGGVAPWFPWCAIRWRWRVPRRRDNASTGR